MKMDRYNIQHENSSFLCRTRMKLSTSKDLPENYSMQYYWSDSKDSHFEAIKYIYLTALDKNKWLGAQPTQKIKQRRKEDRSVVN